MRIGFELLDRRLSRHLIADEKRRLKPLGAGRQAMLGRWGSWSAPGSEQA
jgi:hypothetical protein